jgi:hypothetical protein
MWCHSCWHKEEDGALLCSKCNAKMPAKTRSTPVPSRSELETSTEDPTGMKAVGNVAISLWNIWVFVGLIVAAIGWFTKNFYFK